MKGFNWENFGVLDWRSFMGGGRLQEVVAHGGLTVFGNIGSLGAPESFLFPFSSGQNIRGAL